MKHAVLALTLVACAKEPSPAPTATPAGPAAADDHQLHRRDTADSISIRGRAVPLSSQPTMDWIGLPMSGDLDVMIEVTGTSDLTKANGTIAIKCANCRLGDDKTPIKPKTKNPRNADFIGDGIDFGHVDLGEVNIEIGIKDGMATIRSANVSSNDATLTVTGTVTLGKTLADSTIDACVRFKATEALMQAQPKTYAAVQTTGAPLAADGMFNIKLAGTVGQMRRLGVVCDGTAPAPVQDAPTTDAPAAPSLSDTEPDPETEKQIAAAVTKKNDTTYEVDNAAWAKLLTNTTAMARGARVVPAVRNGQPIGFKLYAIRPGSLYAKLGFLNGDTILKIAGMEMTTADKALEVYAKIRDAKVGDKVTVEIERRGKPITMTYTLK